MKCSRDINLGRGGTRDLRRHQETKLHKHSEKDGVGVLPLQSYFGPIREVSLIHAEVSSHIFLESTILPFNWEIIVPNYSSWCFLILQLLMTCSRTKAAAMSKIYCPGLLENYFRSNYRDYFSLQTDKITDITVSQQAAIMLQFFDNTQGQMRCVFLA